MAAPLAAQDADGFTSLFNGRDMSGWVRVNGAEDTFTARDGMIVITGLPISVMRSARMYENFVLEYEWRHLKSGGNSGCFAWSDGLPQVGGPFPRGIEVQVLDPGYGTMHPGHNERFTTHGDLFPVKGATMTSTGRTSKGGQRSFPSEDRTKPSPEWNHYRVVANAGEIRLSVNGKEVTVGKDCVPRKGYLSLEAEGSEVHFRNLRIKELPSTNTSPEHTAEAFEGFKPLFSGKDFGGWKTKEVVLAAWKVNGSHFTNIPGATGNRLDLFTEKSYRDFTLCADWRLDKKSEGVGGISVRGGGFTVKVGRESGAAVKAGEWNRFFITMKGDRATVVLNGKTVIDGVQVSGLAAEGPIALQYPGVEVEFANLFIREL